MLLLSWDAHGSWRDQITIADVTTRARGIRAEVALTPADGMPRPCVVNLDSLGTIDRATLITHIATLGLGRIAEVDRALHLALGMPLPCPQR